MKKNYTINLALIVASTLIAVFLSELLYRSYVVLAFEKKISVPSPTIWFFNEPMNVYDKQHGFSYNSGTVEYRLQINNNKATYCEPAYYINAFGTFEKDASDFKKAQSESKKTGPRVLVFGASFTTIPYEGETWISLFSKKFKEHIDPHVQVLNFGRDGYGITQALELAADIFPKWKPDVILIAFTSADLRNNKFWRKNFEADGRGYTYMTIDPDDDETSTGSKATLFFDHHITKEWCEKVMKNGGEDPLIAPMAEFYEKVRRAELNKTAPDFFAPQSYLYNRIIYGQAVTHHPKSPLKLLSDPVLKAAIQKLTDSKIPYYFVDMPLISEMEKNIRWELPVNNKKFIKDLLSITGPKQILFLGDYMALSKGQLARFPVSPEDGHPSKEGIAYIADAMLNLYKAKDIARVQDDQWMKNKPEALTRQINLSPLLDSPEGWGSEYVKAKAGGGDGVVVGPNFKNVFAQRFSAKPDEHFKIIARASVPKTIWNLFGLIKKKSMGRFQINWSSSGKFTTVYLESFEVTMEEMTYGTYVVAPPGTDTGILYVSPSGPDDVVRYTEMRLLGK